VPIRLPILAALMALPLLSACARIADRGDYPELLPIDAILAEAGVDPLPVAPSAPFAAP